MTEKKRYTVILRGDIRVEVESADDLVQRYKVRLQHPDDFRFLGGVSGEGLAKSEIVREGFVFRADEVVAVLQSSAITTPTYEPVVQTEESEFEASERARKERGE